ncbi:MAG: transposase, partial [Flammeovirgaceae bacterium]
MIRNEIEEGKLYFLTLTVVDWIDVFTRPAYKLIIVDSLKFCQKRKGLLLYAWCLMSNHLHLIASTKENIHLANLLRDFKQFTAKRILKAIEEELESRKDWMLYQFAYHAKYRTSNKKYKFWRIDTLFSTNKLINVNIIEEGGWHFSKVKNERDIFNTL